MKKLRMSLMAFALTIGVVGAFATSHKAQRNLDNPNWQTEAPGGGIVSTDDDGLYQPNLSLSEAEDAYGCFGSATNCAVTVTGENGSITASPQRVKHAAN